MWYELCVIRTLPLLPPFVPALEIGERSDNTISRHLKRIKEPFRLWSNIFHKTRSMGNIGLKFGPKILFISHDCIWNIWLIRFCPWEDDAFLPLIFDEMVQGSHYSNGSKKMPLFKEHMCIVYTWIWLARGLIAGELRHDAYFRLIACIIWITGAFETRYQ